MRLQIWLLVGQVITSTRCGFVPTDSISSHASTSLEKGQMHTTADFETDYKNAINAFPPYFDPETGLKNHLGPIQRYRTKAEMPMYDHLDRLVRTNGDKRRLQFYALAHGQTPSMVLKQGEVREIRKKALQEAGVQIATSNGDLHVLEKGVMNEKYKEGIIKLGIASREWLHNQESITKEEKKFPFYAINARRRQKTAEQEQRILTDPFYQKPKKKKKKSAAKKAKGNGQDFKPLEEELTMHDARTHSPIDLMKSEHSQTQNLRKTTVSRMPSSGEETESDDLASTLGREGSKLASMRRTSEVYSRKKVDVRALYAEPSHSVASQRTAENVSEPVFALPASTELSTLSESEKVRERNKAIRKAIKSKAKEKEKTKVGQKGKNKLPDSGSQIVTHEVPSVSLESALTDQVRRSSPSYQHHDNDHRVQNPNSPPARSTRVSSWPSSYVSHQQHQQDDNSLWSSPDDYYGNQFWSDPLYHLTRPLSPRFAGVTMDHLPHELAPQDHNLSPHQDDHEHVYFGLFD